jgi:hypothetical protein
LLGFFFDPEDPQTLVDFQWTSWRYIPEDKTLQISISLYILKGSFAALDVDNLS